MNFSGSWRVSFLRRVDSPRLTHYLSQGYPASTGHVLAWFYVSRHVCCSRLVYNNSTNVPPIYLEVFTCIWIFNLNNGGYFVLFVLTLACGDLHTWIVHHRNKLCSNALRLMCLVVYSFTSKQHRICQNIDICTTSEMVLVQMVNSKFVVCSFRYTSQGTLFQVSF